MGLHDPLPDDLGDILREIVRIDDEIEALAFFTRHKQDIASGKIVVDFGAAVAALLLGGPASLVGLALTVYAFASPVYDIMRMLAKTRGHGEVAALSDALKIRRARLWRKARSIDPNV